MRMLLGRRNGFLASAPRLIETRHRFGEALAVFPFIDRRAAEAPRAADTEAGNQSAPQQPIDGGRVNAQVF